jgi:hypothetical protein
MTVTFSDAAIERLLDCYDQPVGVARDREEFAARLARLIEAAEKAGLPDGEWELDRREIENWHGSGAALEVLAFAGLVELGVTAGYIDLSTDGGQYGLVVRDGLVRFKESVLSQSGHTDLTLVQNLLARYEQDELIAPSHDQAAFCSFESYVNLTSSVRTDPRFLSFLVHTHRGWARARDLPFLISPRHFADALVDGRVGQVAVPEVSGGFYALRYFEWLLAILRNAGSVPALQSGIARHATWSYSASRVLIRFDLWANHMNEWSDSGTDSEGELAWGSYVADVFAPLIEVQKELHLPEISYEERVILPTITSEVTELPVIRELNEQGRTGAARRRAVASLEVLQKRLHEVSDEDMDEEFIEAATQFLEYCQTLAALGDLDSAAAFMAPVLERYTLYGLRTEEATRVVADARKDIAQIAEGSRPETSTVVSLTGLVKKARISTKAQTSTKAEMQEPERHQESEEYES